jgi:hypothetical protein
MGMSNVDLAQLNACLNNFLIELLHVWIWHKTWVLHIIRWMAYFHHEIQCCKSNELFKQYLNCSCYKECARVF